VFQVSLAQARDDLLAELDRLRARDVVISTMIPTRRDGLPYAGRSWKNGDDPGVAVYFTLAGKPRSIPCDTYTTPEANLRAIGLSVAAMRALERYGVQGMLDRAFAGFTALPAPDRVDWRAALGFAPGAKPTAEEVRLRHRALAIGAHPDRGGSEVQMARMNAARDVALREIGGADGQ
jgi:hypothetical protein